MRKVFRMKYEPCNGQCYTCHEVVNLTSLANDQVTLRRLLDKMVKAHEPLCGNANIAYGIDFDEESRIFIASFMHYGKLELFANQDLVKVLETLCDSAIAHFASEAGIAELATDPGFGHDVCHHGEDEKLTRFMIEHSGLVNSPADVDDYLANLRMVV